MNPPISVPVSHSVNQTFSEPVSQSLAPSTEQTAGRRPASHTIIQGASERRRGRKRKSPHKLNLEVTLRNAEALKVVHGRLDYHEAPTQRPAAKPECFCDSRRKITSILCERVWLAGWVALRLAAWLLLCL